MSLPRPGEGTGGLVSLSHSPALIGHGLAKTGQSTGPQTEQASQSQRNQHNHPETVT